MGFCPAAHLAFSRVGVPVSLRVRLLPDEVGRETHASCDEFFVGFLLAQNSKLLVIVVASTLASDSSSWLQALGGGVVCSREARVYDT
jgi:hypothetical protein